MRDWDKEEKKRDEFLRNGEQKISSKLAFFYTGVALGILIGSSMALLALGYYW